MEKVMNAVSVVTKGAEGLGEAGNGDGGGRMMRENGVDAPRGASMRHGGGTGGERGGVGVGEKVKGAAHGSWVARRRVNADGV